MENKIIADKKQTILPLLKNCSSRKEWEEISWLKILKSKKLLQTLVTSYERHIFVIRAATMEGLMAGKRQRELSRELFVSLQTINAVKKAMAENNYLSYLQRSKKERKKKEYSTSSFGAITKRKGRPKRTKYGIVYMPY